MLQTSSEFCFLTHAHRFLVLPKFWTHLRTWYYNKTLDCFYSDNDIEMLSPKIKNLVNLRILAIRDNELVEVPEEIGYCTSLRELHLQGNSLRVFDNKTFKK